MCESDFAPGTFLLKRYEVTAHVSYRYWTSGVYLLIAGCGGASGPVAAGRETAAPAEASNRNAPREPEDDRVAKLIEACRSNPAVCDEAAEAERQRNMDIAERECLDGTWSSCAFLYHAGPEGRSRIQGAKGPLRWFKVPVEVRGRGPGGEISVTVYRGTPVFRIGKEGSSVRVTFPQLYLVTENIDGNGLELETSDAHLSVDPIRLRPPPPRGRRVRGFERALATEPGGETWIRTRCGPLFIVDDQKTKPQERHQRLMQIIDGVRVSGWTSEPIDYDLGPCFQENALVFASDGTPEAGVVEVNAERLSRDFGSIWQTGFVFFEHVGEGAPCVRRTVDGEEVVSEWSGDGRRDTWRVIRTGIHLIFLGPTIQHRDQRSAAYGGAALYTVLGIEEDAVIVTGGAERGEKVTAYHPNLVRHWWRSKGACERDRKAHDLLPPLKRKEIQSYADQ